MKSLEEIKKQLDYLYEQYAACIKEEKWTAAAIFRAQAKQLEWVIS